LSFGAFLVACSNGAVPEPLFDIALKVATQRPSLKLRTRH
jgi:hypothetical protein